MILRYGMTKGLELIRASEGFDPKTPVAEVWKAVMLRAEVEYEIERRLAMTLTRSLSAMSGEGGTFLDIARHLFPDCDIRTIADRKKEVEEENSAMRRLDMFRRIAERFEE